MLVEFSVKNFMSIKDEIIFSMVKGKEPDLEHNRSFESNAPATPELLKSAVVYGANASGKTNFIVALRQMSDIVTESAVSYKREDEIPVRSFAFNEKAKKEPTEFQVTFVTEGVRYQYGFITTEKKILDEWLFAFPHGRPQSWFRRLYNECTSLYEWTFSSSLKGNKNTWKESTRENALFLSTAINLNSEQLKPVYDWFSRKLRVTSLDAWHHSFSMSQCENADKKSKIIDFLNAADINIDDIKVTKSKFITTDEYNALPDEMKAFAQKNKMTEEDVFDTEFIRKDKNGVDIPLNIDMESMGTKKLFSLSGPWLDTLERGYILVIDELHDKLHPLLLRYLVELFHSNANTSNAQLIFTTHDVSVLNQDVFRRDQVWMCEKNSEFSTSLNSLAEFSVKKNTENLERMYLTGRYGGIPFIKNEYM